MPKFTVELCYTIPLYALRVIDAPDAETAQSRALHNIPDEVYSQFEENSEGSSDIYVSECVEGDQNPADAPQDAHRPIHPDYRSDEQNTEEARDKLYALVQKVANVNMAGHSPDTANLRAFRDEARELIGWTPGASG